MCVCMVFGERFQGCVPFCRGQRVRENVHVIRLIYNMCGPNIRAETLLD